MVSGGGAIGNVRLGMDTSWLLVGIAVLSLLIGDAQPHRKRTNMIREKILCM
jgi:hypothetical protein